MHTPLDRETFSTLSGFASASFSSSCSAVGGGGGGGGGGSSSSSNSGDRFIPNRSAMDMEVGHYNLISKENVLPNHLFSASDMSPSKRQYKECLAQSLLSHALKPEECKILALKCKAPAPKEGSQNRLRVLYTQNNVDPNVSKQRGLLLPQNAEHILDAPNILDDYYLNLLDWSMSNMVSIGLGAGIYIWNVSTRKIIELAILQGALVTSVSWAQVGSYLGTLLLLLLPFFNSSNLTLSIVVVVVLLS
jgi:cell division cycle protein 20 (cofactor of APC complex)